jgi:hypothetical protein
MDQRRSRHRSSRGTSRGPLTGLLEAPPTPVAIDAGTRHIGIPLEATRALLEEAIDRRLLKTKSEGFRKRARPLARLWALGVVAVIAAAVVIAGAAVLFSKRPQRANEAISDDCPNPFVVLAWTPKANGPNYRWNVTRQTLLVRGLHVVSTDPGTDEVHLATYEYSSRRAGGGRIGHGTDVGPEKYALVATCHDGGTCNEVARTYRKYVRSAGPPELWCGKPDSIGDSPVGTFDWNPDRPRNVPAPDDVQGLCARINACRIATDPNVGGDPFRECQAAPGNFKTACAVRWPCSSVLACLDASGSASESHVPSAPPPPIALATCEQLAHEQRWSEAEGTCKAVVEDPEVEPRQRATAKYLLGRMAERADNRAAAEWYALSLGCSSHFAWEKPNEIDRLDRPT